MPEEIIGKYDWIAAGSEEARYQFLAWLTGPLSGDSGCRPVSVQYGDAIKVLEEDGMAFVRTPKMLPYSSLLIVDRQRAEDYAAMERILEKNSGGTLLWFVDFPYGQYRFRETLKQLRSEYDMQTMVAVFMPNRWRFGATDLSSPESDQKAAEAAYQEDGIPVVVCCGDADLYRVLGWSERLSEKWKRSAMKNLSSIDDRLEELIYDYEFVMQEINFGENQALSNFVKMLEYASVVKTGKKDVWDAFSAAAMKEMFPENPNKGLYPIRDLYRKVLEDCKLGVWDIQNDTDTFTNRLKAAFQDCLRKQRPAEAVSVGKTKDEFEARMKNLKFDSLFEKAVKGFVEKDAFQLLDEQLRKRKKQLEQMLGGLIK